MRIYNTTLNYYLDGCFIILEELKPSEPENYGLYQVISDIAECENLNMASCTVIYKIEGKFYELLLTVSHETELSLESFQDLESAKSSLQLTY